MKELHNKLYNLMFRIRKVEEKIIELYPEQEMRCPTHLYIGQEAIAAGVCGNLNKSDVIFTNHRSHGHYLAKGGDLKKFFAELYGKETGCAKGYGGSMHLIDRENGVWGGSAIVGGAIPLAVGAALSFKLKKEDKVAVVFFGDGAVEEGVFHESLNFASLHNLPVIFVCENNFYAVQTGLSSRQANKNIYQKAAAYSMHGTKVDGTRVCEVYKTTQKAYERAKNGEGPTLIEATTYRWKGHVGTEEDYAMGHRTKEELEMWKERCPLKRCEEYCSMKSGSKDKEIEEEINNAVAFAKKSPEPKLCQEK